MNAPSTSTVTRAKVGAIMRRTIKTNQSDTEDCISECAWSSDAKVRGLRRCGIAALAIAFAAITVHHFTTRPTTPDFRTMDVASLTHHLEAGDNATRRHATDALARLGPAASPAVAALGAALRDADSTVRGNASIALAKIGRPAVSVLVCELKGPEVQARRSASSLLESLGADAEAAVSPLISALNDSDDAVTFNATRALAKVGLPAVPALIDASRNSASPVRIAALTALGEIGSTANDTMAAIRERLADDIEDVRCVAAISLIRVIHRDVDLLESALDDACHLVRQHAAAALGDLGPSGASAGQKLIRLLDDGDIDVRRQSAIALGRIRLVSPNAVPELIDRLNDPSIEVRHAVVESLGNFGREAQAAVPKLFELLTDPSATICDRAAKALEKIVYDSIAIRYASRPIGNESW